MYCVLRINNNVGSKVPSFNLLFLVKVSSVVSPTAFVYFFLNVYCEFVSAPNFAVLF